VSVGSSSARDSKDSPQLLDFAGFSSECSGFLKTVEDCVFTFFGDDYLCRICERSESAVDRLPAGFWDCLKIETAVVRA